MKLHWITKVAIGVLVLALCSIGALLVFIGATSTPQVSNSDAQKSAAIQASVKIISPVAISAFDLYYAYQMNEIKADDLYKGKWLTVSGFVADIGIALGTPFVYISSNGDISHATYASFKDNLHAQLANLQRHQAIEVTCMGSGMHLGHPYLDCTTSDAKIQTALDQQKPSANAKVTSDAKSVIVDYEKLSATCQTGTDDNGKELNGKQVEASCKARDEAYAKVKASGWCNTGPTEYEWVQCSEIRTNQ